MVYNRATNCLEPISRVLKVNPTVLAATKILRLTQALFAYFGHFWTDF